MLKIAELKEFLESTGKASGRASRQDSAPASLNTQAELFSISVKATAFANMIEIPAGEENVTLGALFEAYMDVQARSISARMNALVERCSALEAEQRALKISLVYAGVLPAHQMPPRMPAGQEAQDGTDGASPSGERPVCTMCGREITGRVQAAMCVVGPSGAIVCPKCVKCAVRGIVGKEGQAEIDAEVEDASALPTDLPPPPIGFPEPAGGAGPAEGVREVCANATRRLRTS